MKLKKVIGLVISLMFVFSFVACGNSQSSNDADVSGESPETESSEADSPEVVSQESESTEAENSETESKEVDSTEGSDAEEPVSKDVEEESLMPEVTPVVFMTTDITSEGMMAVYEALEWTP